MILLTGATGLLGSRLLFDLVSKGHKVRAIRREPLRKNCLEHYFLNPIDLEAKVEWMQGDVTDIFSLENAMQGITHVYHCAGKVSFQHSDRDKMHLINIQGTANVVNVCLDKKIEKLCFVSSVAAIGRTGTEEMIDENAAWKTSKFNSSYAVSKYGAEREVWRGIAEGLDAVIVNPGVIIGPGNWKTDSSMLFSRVAKGLKFYTSGLTGFVDVKDVSQAMIMLMEGDIKNERFILVGENKTFRDVMDRIADAVGKPRPSVYAGPLLSGLAWRMESLKSFLSGSRPVITKETARSANGKNYYSSVKIKNAMGLKFSSVDDAIDKTAEIFIKLKV